MPKKKTLRSRERRSRAAGGHPAVDHLLHRNHRPAGEGPDAETAFRQAIRDQIARTFGPLLADLALAHALGEEKWAVLADEPVPAEFLAKVPALRAALKKELAERGIEEEIVKHWLGKGFEVREHQTKARDLKKQRPDFEGQLRRQIAAMKKMLQGGTWLLPGTREALDANVRLMEVVLTDLGKVDRTIERLLREDVLGKGRARHLDALIAAEGLTKLMKERTGGPEVGLVAALLTDAGLLPGISCWQSAPTLGPREQATVWCARAKKGGRACSRDPLRCAVATERVEALLKASTRERRRKPPR